MNDNSFSQHGEHTTADDMDWGAAGDAIRFLQAFDPSGWHNLVAFSATTGKPIDASTFPPNHWAAMAEWINDHCARDHNVYFSVNEPRLGAANQKLKKKDIVRIRAVFGDVDPQGGADELDAERARIHGEMHELMNGPMPPSFVVDSGGGCQVFWKVEAVEASATNLRTAEDIGECLSKLLGGDSIQNVDRIMRLPGTDNVPNAVKRRKGRVRRRAMLLFNSGAVYMLGQLAEEFPPPPETEKATKERTREWAKYRAAIDMDAIRACDSYSDLDAGLRARFEDVLARWPKLHALWGRGEKDGDKTGSGYVLSLGFHLANHGFSLMDFAHLAWGWKFTPGASGRAVNGGPRSLSRVWARVQTERAKEGNPYLGMSFDELLAAAAAIDVQAAKQMRVVRRQIIEAGVRARLDAGEIDDLLKALKQSTKTGMDVLRRIWKDAANRARQAEQARAAAAGGDEAIGGDWMQELQRNNFGDILANVHNTVLILRSPNFAGMLDYDEMQAATMLRRPIPEPGRPTAADFRVHMFDDIDLTIVQARLQRLWVAFVSRNVVAEAIELVARDNSYHPIRDWLDGLAWDGAPRLDTWLARYLGAEASESHSAEYLKEIGPKFLISMVARVYQPGCKVDYMLVLEGGQGRIKSTACRVLAGDAFFSDSLREVTSKDAAQHLRGLWLVEIAELEAMGKAESSAMKAFITRTTERYRPPYGRKEVVEPRQVVFVGTTNETAYLKDATGNRRFWPVRVGRIDFDGLGRDRDQIFAEAAVRYRAGEHWWPEADAEARYIAPVQASRYADDPWREPIETWLDGLGTGDAFIGHPAYGDRIPEAKRANVRKEQTTVYDIARYALGRRNAEITQRDRLRIIAVLNVLDWLHSHKSHGRAAYKRKKNAHQREPNVFD